MILDRERHLRVKELFLAALAGTSEERERVLESSGENLSLISEVRSLLDHADSDGEPTSSPDPKTSAAPGDRVGPYRLLRRLGEGGMGVVYEAADDRLGRSVAVKLLPAALTGFGPARSRLLREARAAAALDHPSVCAVHEVAETADGQVYLAMAYYPGESLRERLQRRPLTVAEAVAIALRIARGLDHAHGRGIVHRDLKPANVQLEASGGVRILDFGLAKLAGAARLSGTGSAMGTPAYMAPEQIRSSDVDPRADVWSLGVLLHEMVTGALPFRGGHPQAAFYSILHDPPERLAGRCPGAPVALQGIVDRALEKDPARRFPDAASFAAALEDLERTGGGSDESGAAPAGARPTPRRRLLPAAAGVLLALGILGALGGGAFFSRRGAPPTAAAGPSVAVLPFTVSPPDAEADYLALGLPERLTAALARVEGVRVAAFSGGAQLRRSGLPDDEAGRRLGAGAVVTGTIAAGADGLTVSAELVDVATGRRLWSERYEEPPTGLATVEARMASAVASALGSAASVAEPPAAPPTPEAYPLYLKGRYLQGLGQLQAALRCYDQALGFDPGFADAHALRARTLGYLGLQGLLPAADAYPEGLSAAAAALAIQPRNGPAWVALAHLRLFSALDWQGSEDAFRRAVEVDPQSADAHYGLGSFAVVRGNFDLARAELERALEIDPVSSAAHFQLARAYFFHRDFRRAEALFRQSLELNPTYSWAAFLLSRVLWELGRRDEAAEAATSLPAEDREVLRRLAAGDLAAARRLVDERERSWRDIGSLEPTWLWPPVARALLGDRDRALDWLESQFEARGGLLFAQTRQDPIWDPIRDDPRFVDLVRRSGVEDVATPPPPGSR